jgi:hypothetical protein
VKPVLKKKRHNFDLKKKTKQTVKKYKGLETFIVLVSSSQFEPAFKWDSEEQKMNSLAHI